MAMEKIYQSHKKGLLSLNKTYAEMEEEADKVAEQAWYAFVEIVANGDLITETCLGSVKNDFKVGFITKYLEGIKDE